jgi:hypothetical protein
MAVTVYRKTSLTGGLAGDLDSVDGALLLDGDFAFVTEAGILYVYNLDDDSGVAESSPTVIAPDVNPGTKRWLLQQVCADGAVLSGGTNTFAITNGTASATVDAGVAFHADASVHTSDIIKGDTTAGRVLRSLRLTIDNGTVASTLKCTIQSIWNGDAAGPVDNVAKGADTSVFRLDAPGSTLSILNTGITGDAVAVLATNIYQNLSTTALNIQSEKTAAGIQFALLNAATGVPADITVLVDTGKIYLDVTYLTTA